MFKRSGQPSRGFPIGFLLWVMKEVWARFTRRRETTGAPHSHLAAKQFSSTDADFSVGKQGNALTEGWMPIHMFDGGKLYSGRAN